MTDHFLIRKVLMNPAFLEVHKKEKLALEEGWGVGVKYQLEIHRARLAHQKSVNLELEEKVRKLDEEAVGVRRATEEQTAWEDEMLQRAIQLSRTPMIDPDLRSDDTNPRDNSLNTEGDSGRSEWETVTQKDKKKVKGLPDKDIEEWLETLPEHADDNLSWGSWTSTLSSEG
ncbi:hypothetical protein FGG08_006360 [Glutinoglossum americanum]|uniref:Uncharacterized protein n=1 Tax=Glutinoglossum americanum TaxID=1670608 RepID=A0A9P8KV15_9PEZI|nr:hypothetical protein FGG08_006360 [Glutinoglossum americanum]